MLALATLLNFYSLLLLVWWLQGTLRSCPRAKVDSPVVAIEQVHFFLITTPSGSLKQVVLRLS